MTDNQYLSLEQILAADDVVYDDVQVPEWGGVVRVRSLTVGESVSITDMSRIPGDKKNPLRVDTRRAMFLTFQKGVVNPQIDANALERLMTKNSGVVLRVVSRINELSGVTLDEEDLSKNLESSPS